MHEINKVRAAQLLSIYEQPVIKSGEHDLQKTDTFNKAQAAKITSPYRDQIEAGKEKK